MVLINLYNKLGLQCEAYRTCLRREWILPTGNYTTIAASISQTLPSNPLFSFCSSPLPLLSFPTNMLSYLSHISPYSLICRSQLLAELSLLMTTTRRYIPYSMRLITSCGMLPPLLPLLFVLFFSCSFLHLSNFTLSLY